MSIEQQPAAHGAVRAGGATMRPADHNTVRIGGPNRPGDPFLQLEKFPFEITHRHHSSLVCAES